VLSFFVVLSFLSRDSSLSYLSISFSFLLGRAREGRELETAATIGGAAREQRRGEQRPVCDKGSGTAMSAQVSSNGVESGLGSTTVVSGLNRDLASMRKSELGL
jgi:hypothetical protein